MKISKKIVSTGLALVLTAGMIPQVSYADNKSKVDVVESAAKEKIIKILGILAGELNVLFDSTTQVIQGRGSDDIFKIYDLLISESYNLVLHPLHY